MLAKGFLDLFFDAAPHLEYFFQFFELSTKAAFAKAAFDTLEILAADDFLGACYRKAMTPQKLWTLLFLQEPFASASIGCSPPVSI